MLSGDLSYNQHADTFLGAPSLAMWSDGGTFVAGIYTQVGGLQPGTTYKASMGWGAPTDAGRASAGDWALIRLAVLIPTHLR